MESKEISLKETYNRIGEEWHRDHQKDDWWVEGTDRFVSLLRPNALVLDVGCGGGTKSKYLMQKGLRVVGIDFSEKMVEIAQREVPTGTFHVCDLRDIGTLEHQFDGIFAQAVLLHVPKIEIPQTLTGMVGKLASGGYLYIAVK
ncbi:MAG: methyltransferase family protein, partial [Parcubacteria group bacterium Gr01-1014_106]